MLTYNDLKLFLKDMGIEVQSFYTIENNQEKSTTYKDACLKEEMDNLYHLYYKDYFGVTYSIIIKDLECTIYKTNNKLTEELYKNCNKEWRDFLIYNHFQIYKDIILSSFQTKPLKPTNKKR